jgi:hypothetical protein
VPVAVPVVSSAPAASRRAAIEERLDGLGRERLAAQDASRARVKSQLVV